VKNASGPSGVRRISGKIPAEPDIFSFVASGIGISLVMPVLYFYLLGVPVGRKKQSRS
jgi:hypothetical protein